MPEINEQPSPPSAPWLQTLEQTPAVLRAAPAEVFQWKSTSDRWSIIEVLAHLLDMEVNALRLRAQRIRRRTILFSKTLIRWAGQRIIPVATRGRFWMSSNRSGGSLCNG